MTDRRTKLRLWLLSLDRFELSLRKKVARTRARFIITASREYKNNGQIPAWVQIVYTQEMRNILARHYRVVIPYFGKMAMKQIKSIRVEQKTDAFFSFMEEWVTTESLLKAGMISKTDYYLIQDVIGKGLAEGLGAQAIAKLITDVSGLTPYRASVIARTETHNAATFGSIQSARNAESEFGVQMDKIWLATLDNRTRPDHKKANNQKVGLNEKFTVGGEQMDRPGDPSARAENVIHCRCAIAYEEKE